jgi:serine/threonine protein kinase
LFLHRSEEFGLMVKVLDFGIAMFQTRFGNAEFRLTQDNSLLGTPLYMAPEQVLGNRDDISPQTDIWAIGMIVFDMLTGQTYWRVPNLGVLLSKIALGDMPAPSTYAPALPKAFDDWFARSCAHARNNRFSSVREADRSPGPCARCGPSVARLPSGSACATGARQPHLARARATGVASLDADATQPAGGDWQL